MAYSILVSWIVLGLESKQRSAIAGDERRLSLSFFFFFLSYFGHPTRHAGS